MVFSSFSFIFLFLPVFLAFYWIIPRELCPATLTIGSLVFYTLGVREEPWQLVLLLGITVFGALGCLLFSRPSFRKKWLIALWIGVVAGPLLYVKMMGLFTDSAPALPLGLSFYTFQLIALLAFAFKGGESSFINVVTCTVMFPKLISGPLTEPDGILSHVAKPKRRLAWLDDGLERFIIGLGLKVVVADHLAGVLGQIHTWGVEAVSVQMAWLGVLCYALQLYFDFWGYSCMAVGIGLMLGIKLPENFDNPYCASSVSDFWRRWHITLGLWFRNHIYIPMGGSRHGTLRMVVSTLAVWLLTGLWHGGGWNYVAWGLMMFVLIMGERMLYGNWLGRHPVLGHIYVPLFIGLSWIFFMTSSLSDAIRYFYRLIGGGGIAGSSSDWQDALRWCWPFLAIGLVQSTPFPKKLWQKISGTGIGWLLLFNLFWVCIYFLATATSNPFLYFSF